MRNNIIKKIQERPKNIKKNPDNAPGTNNLSINKKVQNLLNKAYSSYTQEFEKHVSPIIELSEEDRICAYIANESYNSQDKRKDEIEGFIIDKDLSNEDIAIYIDKVKKICIIGIRGTVITEFKDLSSDAQILLDIQGIDPRVKGALHMYDICKRQYEHFAFRVCGHSLGGTLSYIVAKHRNPEKCVVFNPGVSLNTFFFQMLEDTMKKTIRTEKTNTYKILGDIISTAAFVGHTKVFGIKSKDPLKMHAMENFVLQKKEIDNTNTKDSTMVG